MKFIIIQLLKAYKYFISPLFGSRCRFYPSCSEYMMTAVERFGIIKGIVLGVKRLGRCHPGCEGGIDYVPEIHLKQIHSKEMHPKEIGSNKPLNNNSNKNKRHNCEHKHD